MLSAGAWSLLLFLFTVPECVGSMYMSVHVVCHCVWLRVWCGTFIFILGVIVCGITMPNMEIKFQGVSFPFVGICHKNIPGIKLLS